MTRREVLELLATGFGEAIGWTIWLLKHYWGLLVVIAVGLTILFAEPGCP